MDRVLVAVARLIREDRGQDLVEYGLLAVLIAVVLFLTVASLGTAINSVFWQPIAQNF